MKIALRFASSVGGVCLLCVAMSLLLGSASTARPAYADMALPQELWCSFAAVTVTADTVLNVTPIGASSPPTRAFTFDPAGSGMLTVTAMISRAPAYTDACYVLASPAFDRSEEVTLTIPSGETETVLTYTVGPDAAARVPLLLETRHAYGGAITVAVGDVYPLEFRRIQRIFLPLALRNWVYWYLYDPYEPNDTPAQAYGPLASGVAYETYIWDQTDKDDYYYFTATLTASMRIDLDLSALPAGVDYDLYVYYYDGAAYQLVAKSDLTGQNEWVEFTAVAGRKYYVRVYPYQGSSNRHPYRLTMTY